MGRAEAEQDEQAELGGGGTQKSVTAKLYSSCVLRGGGAGGECHRLMCGLPAETWHF